LRRLELGNPLIGLHTARQLAAATSEILHRFLRRVRGEIGCGVTERGPLIVVKSARRRRHRIQMTGRHIAVGQSRLEDGHLVAHRLTIRRRLRIPRRASPTVTQDPLGSFRTTLIGELTSTTRDPHLEHIREAPHRPPLGEHGVQPDPVTRPEINRRQPIDRRTSRRHQRIELPHIHAPHSSTAV